jgi:N-acetylglucosamine kinase-like BadF-type ATPase
LYDAICDHWQLGELLDLVDMWLEHDPGWDRAGELAPLVFEQAARGDEVAREILRRAGREMAHSAQVLIHGLFEPSREVTVVLGGSVLQQRRDSTLTDALVETLAQRAPGARVVVLEAEPVVGAVLLAAQSVLDATAARQVRAGLEKHVGGALVRAL